MIKNNTMSWETEIPTFESGDRKLENQINEQLRVLLKNGTKLEDIVELLDAQDFFQYEKNGKSEPVGHFDVAGLIKKRTYENRGISLPEKITKLNDIILPPSKKEIQAGNKEGLQELKIMNRSALLVEVLSELKLKYSVIEGENAPNMMRKLSYFIFDLPLINKLVFVNNEEGNATFVINLEKEKEWKSYANKTKEELSGMSDDVVSILLYPNKNKEGHQERWKEKIKELLLGIVKNKEQIEEVQDGWMTVNSLAATLDSSFPTVKSYAEEYRKGHPEWFRIFKSKMGQPREFYSSELIKIITEKVERFKSIPEGWQNIETLMKEIGISKATLRKSAQAKRERHPEWFRTHEDSIGKREMYYHPDLIAMLKKEFKDNNPSPPGWLTLTPIMEGVGTDFRTINKLLDVWKTEHPEWVKNYRDSKGETKEHYSPEFVAFIKEKYTPTSDGWITPNRLATLLRTDPRRVKEFAEKYKKTYPDWFKDYKDSRAGIKEHYSPELIEKIKKEM